MAKRDTEIEPLNEEPAEPEVRTVGERLRAAREEKGLSLEDIAAQTRIPQRHLESIEVGNWDALPAPTYTTGFAKSYATAVGLDRVEIGEQLRAEMGNERSPSAMAEVFEPADPARTMPKSLVLGTIAAVILLVILMSWLNRRSLDQADEPATNAAAPAATAPAQAPQAAAPAAQGPVVLAALQPVWLQVTDSGATLYSGMLQPGQTFAVPPTATTPLLKTGKPEALRITVGSAVAPPVGPPATTVSDVSLRAADLLKAGQAPSPAPAAAVPQATTPAPPQMPPAPAARRRAPAPVAPPPPPPAPPPATNTTG